MINKTAIAPEKLKKMINSCDFADESFRKEWETKADKLPPDALQIVYKKFSDAKRKVDNVYMSIALRYDPTGGKLIRETIKTIQSLT